MAKMRQSNSGSVHAKLAAVVAIFLFTVSNGTAQQSLDSNYRMTGDGVLAVFEPQRLIIQKCSAALYDGRELVSYGVVVSSDGYIVTKASEVEKITNLDVRVDSSLFKKAKIVMVDPRWDVALVKVDAVNLTPARFADHSDLQQGTWVVVNGATSRSRRRILAGIISANQREIAPEGGAVLGVQLKKTKSALIVEEVTEGSGAEQAGLKGDDVILSVDGAPVGNIKALTELLDTKKSGSRVKVSVRRGDEKMELDVRLSGRGELFREVSRNDMMSGDFSNRRSGFPKVLQHDILANSNTMGGPVLNLQGLMIGMNIARANRAETFAIPIEELKPLVAGMIEQSKN